MAHSDLQNSSGLAGSVVDPDIVIGRTRPMTWAVSKIKRLVELSAEIYIARDLRCRLEQCHECKCQRDVEDEGRGQWTDTETEHVETHRGV